MGFELRMANEKNLHIEKTSLIFEMLQGYPATYKYDFDETGELIRFHGETPNIFQKLYKTIIPIFGTISICFGYFEFDSMRLVSIGTVLIFIGLFGVKWREFIAKKAMEEAWPKYKKQLLEKAAQKQAQTE